MKYKLRHAMLLTIVATILYLLMCWMGGYNFATRGEAQGVATLFGYMVCGSPLMIYFILKAEP